MAVLYDAAIPYDSAVNYNGWEGPEGGTAGPGGFVMADDVLSNPLTADEYVGCVEITDEELSERLGTFRPIGRPNPVGVSGGMDGRRGTLVVTAFSSADRTALEALQSATNALRLQTCAGEDFYVRLQNPRRFERVGGHGTLKWRYTWAFESADAP
jgi:hypothetical protein